jgi:dihydropteroate synthase type 2
MTTIFGILNVTDDSFFDGGKYLEPSAALAQARALTAQGADVLDIGAASSNPDSRGVAPEVEIARLASVLPSLAGTAVSIDTFSAPVQRWALAQDVAYLNDIEGFADPALYPELASARARLIVMHSVQQRGQATRVHVPAGEIMDRIHRFFDTRLAALEAAGVARTRLILDPGMGFFLGTDPEASFTVLRQLAKLRARYGLPLLVSVSRKSFLRRITGKSAAEAGPASLAAELYAVHRGADCIRTHSPGALRDALLLEKAVDGRP